MTKRTKNRLASININLDVAFNETVANNPVIAARLIVIREMLRSIEDDAAWQSTIKAVAAGTPEPAKFVGMANVDGEQFAHYTGVVL